MTVCIIQIYAVNCLSSVSDSLPADPVQQQYNFWLSLVDKLGVKAFVDLTLSPSVRQGTQHLLRITGLGKLCALTVGTDYDVALSAPSDSCALLLKVA